MRLVNPRFGDFSGDWQNKTKAIESAQNDQFTVVQSILANKENHLQKVGLFVGILTPQRNVEVHLWSVLQRQISLRVLEVRDLFMRLGAEDTGSITFQMLEESIHSEAAIQT